MIRVLNLHGRGYAMMRAAKYGTPLPVEYFKPHWRKGPQVLEFHGVGYYVNPCWHAPETGMRHRHMRKFKNVDAAMAYCNWVRSRRYPSIWERVRRRLRAAYQRLVRPAG